MDRPAGNGAGEISSQIPAGVPDKNAGIHVDNVKADEFTVQGPGI
jgi:hypothetical protein